MDKEVIYGSLEHWINALNERINMLPQVNKPTWRELNTQKEKIERRLAMINAEAEGRLIMSEYARLIEIGRKRVGLY